MAISVATRTQHAVRLLTLLRVCGDGTGGNDPAGTVQVIRSEKRLQALDFWLRNPDYLADEIVTAVETGALVGSYLQVAEGLLTEPEPALRHFPTPKWFYGAYEAVDDAFALLQSYGLARVKRRGAPPKRLQNQFFLTEDGARAADDMASTNVLDWYAKQANLVHLVAGSDSGTRLKERQYAQETYAKTRWGNSISAIAEQVWARLDEQSSRNAAGAVQMTSGDETKQEKA
jgi:hypothetical protein